MRILVTGAGGFLGRHIVGQCLARGDEVTALDLEFRPPLPPGTEPVVGSVTDRATVDRATTDCDAVVHCAALTGLWRPRPAEFDEVNVRGTETVLDAALAAGISRVVVVSSFVTLISGGRGAPETVNETLELPVAAMCGPYPRSKRRAELMCRAHPVDPVIVLPTAPVGPGDFGLTPPSRMLADLAQGRLPAMLDCTWNFIDVRSLASAVLSALELGTPGRRYLLGGENFDTDGLKALLEPVLDEAFPRLRVPYPVALAAGYAEAAFSAVTGRAPKGPLTGIRLAGPRRTFDTARARAELWYRPEPVAPAFADALDWMRRNGVIVA
ncbi:MAG: NAD-dependent epimerase/dehydratase family protein [Pseudomonadota bacterium]